VEVWLHFADALSATHESELVRALEGVGVKTRTAVDPDEHVPGCICFSSGDESLPLQIARLSDRGRLNVLALCLGANRSNQWSLLDAGASDVLSWNDARQCARTVASRLARWRSINELCTSQWVRESLVGTSRSWRAVLHRLVEVAHFTDANALVLGESGTGKELAARLIHEVDARPNRGELVIVDCTTIVPELSGSEFFGHERGAFTGAVAARDGAFARAHGGTLFLDEVGELPLHLQAQLLRATQERTYKRVGGNTWYETNFRLVCATNRDLRESVRNGTFRHDLYHRIANWTVTLPPLRERAEDIVALTRHFLNPAGDRVRALCIDDAVLDYLAQRSFPGNIRELKHLVARILHRHVGEGPISIGDIPEDERPVSAQEGAWDAAALECVVVRALRAGAGLKEISRSIENCAIRIALKEADGSLRRAAKRLGVTDRALQLRRASARERTRQDCPHSSDGD
jgi:transcriptional regulator with GAF, ATPase, and Fis domain